MAMTVLDWINKVTAVEEHLTKEQFGQIMHGNDEQLKIRALEKLTLAGGYENLA